MYIPQSIWTGYLTLDPAHNNKNIYVRGTRRDVVLSGVILFRGGEGGGGGGSR